MAPAVRGPRAARTESGTYPILQRRIAVVDDDALVARITQMILAQRGYQANVQSFERAREVYESIIGIGR